MRKDSILLNYYYSKLPKKALGGGPDAPLRKGNSKGALNGFQLDQFAPGGVTSQTTKPPTKFGLTGSVASNPMWKNGKLNTFAGMTGVTGGASTAKPSTTFDGSKYDNGYATNDANSNLTAQQVIKTNYVANQANQREAQIAAYKASPYANKNLTDNEIVQLVDASNNSFQNQGTIKAGTDRSMLGKAWAIASNPMTAINYKVRGQDIPDYLERGERNKLDMAFDVLNPAMYANAFGRTANALMNPINTTGRLFNGARDLTYNLAGDDVGWNNVMDAAGIAGDAAMFIPGVTSAVRGAKAARTELLPFIRGAKKTYGLTGDLPFNTRIKNALNSGTTNYSLKGIDNRDYIHHYFGADMKPEDALAIIKQQKAEAPLGALMGDSNMSLNSTPLYFQSAAKDVKNFPVVRTGDFQNLNSMGFKGKRISQSVPNRVYSEHPDIIHEYNRNLDQLNADFTARANRINNDVSIGDVEKQRLLGDLNSAHKQRLTQIAPEKDAMHYIQHDPSLFNEFSANYTPHMDAPIASLSERTGLNFPGSRGYVDPNYGPRWEAPTAYSVKGSFVPRYKAIGNQAKNAFTKEFNPNLRIKTGSNSDAANAFDAANKELHYDHFDRMDEINRMSGSGLIDEATRNQMLSELNDIRDLNSTNFYKNFPNGRPSTENSYLSFNPRNFSIPGSINNTLGIKPTGENTFSNGFNKASNNLVSNVMNVLKQKNSNHIFFK